MFGLMPRKRERSRALAPRVGDPIRLFRDEFDELFDRFDVRQRPAALRAAVQGDFDLLVNDGGHGAMRSRMPGRAAGPFLLVLRDLARRAAAERCGRAGLGLLGLLELLTQRGILSPQSLIGGPERGIRATQRGVLSPQFVKVRRNRRSIHPRRHPEAAALPGFIRPPRTGVNGALNTYFLPVRF